MFNLKSKYSLSGDQPKTVESILKYLKNKNKFQTLWGITGSGKTFVMANIIQKIQKPTLVIAHNKTLAAQLALEFKEFFPDNAVHYFVSYYDYYQPEAYISKTDTYIEKEATINEEIDRLRHAATESLILRKDVIIVASVSCIYGVGNIAMYKNSVLKLKVGEEYEFDTLIKKLIFTQYSRTPNDLKPGNFKIKGDIIEIFPSSLESIYSLEFWGNEIVSITRKHPLTGEVFEILEEIEIFPAKHTLTSKDTINKIIPQIKEELKERLKFFKENGDLLKYERLKTKIEYDLEMIQEVGYVNGIENYSRYLDFRDPGLPPATLIDYFGDDFLCFVDESHMTISQINGMYAGDRSRKENLVESGFRLPSALDNRPLKFDEFESKIKQMVLVSATPGEYDIKKSSKNPQKFFKFDPIVDGDWKHNKNNRIIPLVIRPTGLLDPIIKVKSMKFMIDDIMTNISKIQESNEKMLIITLTKRSSEELTDYLLENGVKVRYLHSEIDTLERIEILKDLRNGKIDIIVGVNLLREGLDLPEVTKIAILDADKQGFLRSSSALIQIIGRAARNVNGTVYMYSECLKGEKLKKYIVKENIGDYLLTKEGKKEELFIFDKGKYLTKKGFFISNAMKKSINLTNYRRQLQKDYNKKNNITPQTIISEIKDIGIKSKNKEKYDFSTQENLEKKIKKLEFEMDIAASNMEYEKAAEIRDLIIELKKEK